jgi:hypothetical protein
MLGCDDAGLAAIQAIALNAAISGSIRAVPEACFAMTMALQIQTRVVPKSQISAPDATKGSWTLAR